jgi:hypothetical protein
MPKVVPSQIVEVIDQIFPKAKDQKDSQQDRFPVTRANQNELAAIVDLFEQIPGELIILDQKDYTALRLAVTAIKNTIPAWNLRDYGLNRIHGFGNLNPVTIIRNSLSKCPDEGVLNTVSDLKFISIQELRESLRIDISSANQAFQNGEWKAATVLAGASIHRIDLDGVCHQKFLEFDNLIGIKGLRHDYLLLNSQGGIGFESLQSPLSAALALFSYSSQSLQKSARQYFR